MALNSIYKITDRQMIYGKRVENVYFYHQPIVFLPVGVLASEVVLNEWKAVVLPKVRQMQGADLVHTEYLCEDLFDHSDTYSELANDAGLYVQSGDTMPAFNALAFRLNVAGSLVKDGSKRIGGLPEEFATDGVVSIPGFINYMNQFSAAVESPLQTGTIIRTDTLFPIVVKRVKEGDAIAGWTYRLPRTLAEAVFTGVVNALYSVVITSQISRKN